MSVTPVSFGKIILVKAPFYAAEEIAVIANSDYKTNLSKQVKAIINDRKDGEAHAYPSPYSKNISYIFSGKEGEKFGITHNIALDKMDFSHHYYSDDDPTHIDIQSAWKKHAKNVRDLIDSAEKIPVIGVGYDKEGYVKSVNVIA